MKTRYVIDYPETLAFDAHGDIDPAGTIYRLASFETREEAVEAAEKAVSLSATGEVLLYVQYATRVDRYLTHWDRDPDEIPEIITD